MIADLSIVIVSWNVKDLLRDCLESIAHEHDLTIEIVVVDSDSSDATPDMLKASFPDVKLIEPGNNVGFTKGNNIGIEACTADLILLLNPDTKVIGDALQKMVDYINQNPKIAVLGPQTLNEDGSVQSTRRRFPTLKTSFFESTWLQPYAPKNILSHYYMTDTNDHETMPVDWVQGSALLTRRSVIDQVGILDEGFFMYSEEMDWQKRIKDAGWQVVYYADAQIIHYGGKSSEKVVAQRDIYFHSSKIRYFRKHHGIIIGLLLRLFLLLNYLWQLGLEAGKWLIGHKREMRGKRVQSYWQVLRSGLRG